MNLESQIEGLLFYKGEDVTIQKLSELLHVTAEEVEAALRNLADSLSTRALVIVRKDNSVTLGISKELSPLIESIRKEEVTKELSKATLETLSIILYKNGVTRAEVDYIRGVNSSFIIRNLLVRGLIEKSVDPVDSRRVLYKPAFDTLQWMGVTSIDQIPNYAEVKAQLDGIVNNADTTDHD
jgi:segregation and condensation protein B